MRGIGRRADGKLQSFNLVYLAMEMFLLTPETLPTILVFDFRQSNRCGGIGGRIDGKITGL
jgi:hypothetical protein